MPPAATSGNSVSVPRAGQGEQAEALGAVEQSANGRLVAAGLHALDHEHVRAALHGGSAAGGSVTVTHSSEPARHQLGRGLRGRPERERHRRHPRLASRRACRPSDRRSSRLARLRAVIAPPPWSPAPCTSQGGVIDLAGERHEQVHPERRIGARAHLAICSRSRSPVRYRRRTHPPASQRRWRAPGWRRRRPWGPGRWGGEGREGSSGWQFAVGSWHRSPVSDESRGG